jgi:branched-chain amino acid transport system ATP-binding protein
VGRNLSENKSLGAYGQRSNVQAVKDKNLQIVYRYFPVLEKKRKQHAGSLSGGEKQMFATGRTLMCELKHLQLQNPEGVKKIRNSRILLTSHMVHELPS